MRLRGALAAAAVAVVAVLAAPAGASTGVTVTPSLITGSGLGFDIASAQRTAVIRAWSASPYTSVNIYFSGSQRFDKTQAQLSADWVTTVLANGWSLIPTVVDLQPPCYGGGAAKMSTDPTTAATQGATVATQADSDLRGLGLGGMIAYLDIENFDVPAGNTTCAPAVQAFVKSYTNTLHGLGDKSGVYFNAHHGAPTLVSLYGHAGAPDDVWVADWNGQATPDDAVLGSAWTGHRLHQYLSDSSAETYGSESIAVDRDAIDGDVVAAGSVHTPSSSPYTYAVSGTPTNNLNERSQPTSSSPIVTSAKNGDPLNIVCQAAGESVDGDPVWDRLDNGNYATDIYTTTTGRNGFSSAIPRCDTTRPTATLNPLPTGVVSAAVTVSWQASDPSNADGAPSGVYDSAVRVHWAPWNGSFGGWHAVVTSTTGRSASWRVTAGYTYCFEVQARDLSGNASFWSAPVCTTRALDDLSLARGSGWTRARSTHFYEGTYTQATSTGRSLTRTGAVASQLALVATTCNRCGAVRVSIAGHVVATVNLYSASTHWQRVIVLPAFALRSGSVVITTTSSSLVQIDGLVIARS